MEKVSCGILIFFLSVNTALANSFGSISFTKAEVLNENTARIPFKFIDHLIVIEAELMGKKGNFIIDTGSETLILNKVHFPSQYRYNKKTKQTSGAVDIIDDVLEKKINAFIMQNFNLTNVISDVIDLSHIEKTKKMNLLGIIGYNILKDFEVFIDLHLNQITLTKLDEFGNNLDEKIYLEKIVDSVSFSLIKHTIVLNCSIGKQKLRFGLDSAAEFGLIDKGLNKDLLKSFYPTKRIVLIGASNNKVEVMAGKLHRVKLSPSVYFGPMNTILTNLNNMNTAYGTRLDGVFGYDFFEQKRTIINYKKKKLYFINYPVF